MEESVPVAWLISFACMSIAALARWRGEQETRLRGEQETRLRGEQETRHALSLPMPGTVFALYEIIMRRYLSLTICASLVLLVANLVYKN